MPLAYIKVEQKSSRRNTKRPLFTYTPPDRARPVHKQQQGKNENTNREILPWYRLSGPAGHQQLKLPYTFKDKLDSYNKENKRRYMEAPYQKSSRPRQDPK